MKITRKQFLTATAALAATSALAACSSSSDSSTSTSTSSTSSDSTTSADPTEVSLYIYYVDSNVTMIDEALEILKSDYYPDLTINIEHRDDATGDVLRTKAAVGELPDIMEMQSSFVQDFIDAGYLVPLNDSLDASGLKDVYIENTYLPQLNEDGNYYTFRPAASQPYTIFYNTEVFDALALSEPTNYEEFKVIITTLVDNGYLALTLFAEETWPGLQLYDLAVIANGNIAGIGALEDGNVITEDAYVAAAQQIEEVIDLGLVSSGAFSTNASQAFEYFGNNQAGMIANGAWFFADAIDGDFAEKTGYFSYNPFAAVGDEETYRYNVSGGGSDSAGFAVSTHCASPEFVQQVMFDFLYEFNQAEGRNGKMTAFIDAPEPYDPFPDAYQAFIDNMSNIQSTSDYGWSMASAELLAEISAQTELLLTGTYTADSYISDLEEIIEDVLG